jgi:hypothetical protein
MTEAELIEAVKAIAEGLRSDLTESITKLDAKCNSIADSVAKIKADAAKRDPDDYGNDPDGAMLTAADRARSDSVGRGELAVLARAVSDLQRKVSRPMTAADRNSLADAQARADAVMRVHGTQAERRRRKPLDMRDERVVALRRGGH